MEWPKWVAYQEEISTRKKPQDSELPASISTIGVDVDEPEEIMANKSRDFNSLVETNLRRRLQESSPAFFEKAVLELLWAMGYGGAHGSKEHLGQSGDGGIDGVIRQDTLGLSKVYVQAKRYSDGNNVGSGEIRNFIGALDSKGSNQGVFITSSKFAPAATTTANNYRHGTIVLIDGIELTRLMLAYGVAVQTHRIYTLYEIDEDFFDDSDT
ncbi:5-methylcytosine-specific restriction enzyme MRR [Corynebacterium vitaeruminis DSM 20294]|uniref:5-methylcytosine-specific restriction enzyme MRR n=1 Tax=Corynebacterium vitaeruminis DSM 20294 TaxID=1224164 RepID=W5Y3X5_9CORY|nr:5-methylcytosine-specific restriction enzyme MRR [Corynebacterium vitaeruminis DSM 20294]